MQGLLPSMVAVDFALGDVEGAPLFAAEAAAVAGATNSRRLEFATSRLCARRALARLGLGDTPILRGQRGEPLWPPTVVGSITHCRGFRAACVAWRRDVPWLGIDAEPHAALPREIRDLVLRPEEAVAVRRGDGGVHWDLLVHCVKECVYKAWFPITGLWLDHQDVRVRWDPSDFSVRADILVATGASRDLTPMRGRFVVWNGLLVAAVSGAPQA